MISLKALSAVCLGATLCFAQAINIRGTVKDSASVGIPGATVKLEVANISTTTGADGSFTLANGSTQIQQDKNIRGIPASPVRIQNGKVAITLAGNTPVATDVYSVGGRQIYRNKQIYGPGIHTVQSSNHSAGISLYKLSIGKESYLFKSSPVGAFTAERTAGTIGASALARQAKANDVIADVLSVIKKGQLNYRVPVNTSDTSGIVVKMITNAGDVKDADSNVYQSVRLGNQVWMVENLRTTKYRDGTPIPLEKERWGLLAPNYCFYDNYDSSTALAKQQKWGALYSWCAVNTGKLAPTGWHVPTDAEWDTLQNYLIAKGYNWDGTTTGNKIGKSMAAKTDWFADTTTGTIGKDPGMNNASGFSGISGGYRWASGVFGYQETDGYWWSATEDYTEYAYARHLGYTSESLIREIFNERMGVSVRVLRD